MLPSWSFLPTLPVERRIKIFSKENVKGGGGGVKLSGSVLAWHEETLASISSSTNKQQGTALGRGIFL